MISIEQYAELCALMADTAGDVNQENAIAAAHGVSAADWLASKTGFTAKMSDPTDMGRTAMAFMPLYQAAQARARGGKEPCTLAFYTKVHAEMAFKKDPLGHKLNHHLVLAENGTHHQAWLECEGYWTPIVGAPTILGQPNPKFDPQLSAQFSALMQQESDRIHGITR
jgi:methyl coenzyme M reductase alpha subunit